ncbi:hypothetical protein NE237_021868 [Protea cynaroides]|uniref:ZF-HD dimerization-type domain-containing protein n=1 Tax=Protea cynaroides TaxID=273540 RepID=A0A9Q0HC08_9MAGN|nr:hypothetical protein NE237_021868 [Protea cynaroides]
MLTRSINIHAIGLGMNLSGFGSEISSEQKLFEEESEELGFESMKKGGVVSKRDEQRPYRSYTTSTYTVRSVRYGECQKNHAASIGGYAVDGCREFMACGEEGTNALKCAACGCHRNFHQREVETEVVCECSSPPPSNGK